MDNIYNIKLKKGDVKIEISGSDKDFVSNKFTESVLVAFDKSVAKETIISAPVEIAEQVAEQEAVAAEPVQAVEVAQPETAVVAEANPVIDVVQEQLIVEPALVAAEQVAEQPLQEAAVVEQVAPVAEATQVVEAVKQEDAPIPSEVEAVAVQEAVNVATVQAVPETVVQETVVEVAGPVEPVVEAVVAPVEAVETAPTQSEKPTLASAAQVSEEALSKVYSLKKDGFKVGKSLEGTTALKQTNMTKLVLVASEYLNGVNQLSGKALGKHLKSVGTGNLATNLKKDAGIVKENSFYRLNDAGKQAALDLIRNLSAN